MIMITLKKYLQLNPVETEEEYYLAEFAKKIETRLMEAEKHLRVCMGWTMRASELEISSGMKEAELADLAAAESFLISTNHSTINQPMCWMPIETAPKGGGAERVNDPLWVDPPCILLSFANKECAICYWDWYYAEGGCGYRGVSAWVLKDSGTLAVLEHGEPTHWMQLPSNVDMQTSTIKH